MLRSTTVPERNRGRSPCITARVFLVFVGIEYMLFVNSCRILCVLCGLARGNHSRGSRMGINPTPIGCVQHIDNLHVGNVAHLHGRPSWPSGRSEDRISDIFVFGRPLTMPIRTLQPRCAAQLGADWHANPVGVECGLILLPRKNYTSATSSPGGAEWSIIPDNPRFIGQGISHSVDSPGSLNTLSIILQQYRTMDRI